MSPTVYYPTYAPGFLRKAIRYTTLLAACYLVPVLLSGIWLYYRYVDIDPANVVYRMCVKLSYYANLAYILTGAYVAVVERRSIAPSTDDGLRRAIMEWSLTYAVCTVGGSAGVRLLIALGLDMPVSVVFVLLLGLDFLGWVALGVWHLRLSQFCGTFYNDSNATAGKDHVKRCVRIWKVMLCETVLLAAILARLRGFGGWNLRSGVENRL